LTLPWTTPLSPGCWEQRIQVTAGLRPHQGRSGEQRLFPGRGGGRMRIAVLEGTKEKDSNFRQLTEELSSFTGSTHAQ